MNAGIDKIDKSTHSITYKHNNISNDNIKFLKQKSNSQIGTNSLLDDSLVLINDSEMNIFAETSEILRENKDFLFIRFYYYFLMKDQLVYSFNYGDFELIEQLLNSLISYDSDFYFYELKVRLFYSNKNNLDLVINNDTKIIESFFEVFPEIFDIEEKKIAVIWKKIFQRIKII